MHSTTLLVTGGCGFIGSNFINYIMSQVPTVKVVNLDAMMRSDVRNIDDSIAINDRYTFIKGNYRDDELVSTILTKHNITMVVHFAASSFVDDSYTSPARTFDNNVTGTMHLLQACVEYGKLGMFLHISTDEVYGDSALGPHARPKRESDQLAPTNPYAASKAACEQLIHTYRHSSKLPAIIVRMNNVYGPRQYATNVVPRFINLALEGLPFTIQGSGNQQRNFLYVMDACEAIHSIIERGHNGEIYNIGTSDEKSILELAADIHTMVTYVPGTKPKLMRVVHMPDRPYNDQRYLIDSTKLKRQVGWQPRTPFTEGLKATIQWYAMKKLETKKRTKSQSMEIENEQ